MDQRSDIYSLGVTLYEMVAGRVPFEKPKDSDSDYQVLRAHIEEPPLPPSRLIPTIPAFVEGAILRAMAKRPDERFASCEAFEAALVPPELPPTRRVVAATPPGLRDSASAVAPPAGPLGPASREAARPRVARAAPERVAVPKPVVPKSAPARSDTRAAYPWTLWTIGVVLLAIGIYWLYRVQPRPAPTVTQPRDGTAQKSPAATHEAPARKPVATPAESVTQRPAAVPTRVEPAQPSAAELAAQVQALTKQADAALDHGEYDAAIAAYRRALQVDTTNQEARRGIGRAQKAKAAEEATEKPPATAPAMAQAESGLVLQVAANERAFVAVHVDGKTALQQVLNPGEIHTLKAKESFDVTTGNAQGIVLTLNGETLKPLGRRGEVKSVHLTANDLKKTSP